MAVYKVKNGLFRKSLVQTIQSARSGDTIILDANYEEHIRYIEINKDLTIVGTTITVSGENENQITNVLYGRIVVSNKATLTLRGLQISHECFDFDESNAINIKDATLNIDNCIISSHEKVDIYPMIYAQKAILNIKNSTLSSFFEGYCECLFLESSLTMTHTLIYGLCIHLKDSNSDINHVEMSNNYNCLFLEYSKVTIQNSSISGDSVLLDNNTYPTLFLKQSNVKSENSKFLQKYKTCSSIYLYDKSEFTSTCDMIEKLNCEDSKIYLYFTTIYRQLYLYSGYAYVDDITIKDKYENYYYLVAEQYSSIYGTKVTLEDFYDERVNICKYSNFIVKELIIPEKSFQYYICDDTSFINHSASKTLKEERKIGNTNNLTENTKSDAYETLMNMIGLQKIKDEVDNLKKIGPMSIKSTN